MHSSLMPLNIIFASKFIPTNTTLKLLPSLVDCLYMNCKMNKAYINLYRKVNLPFRLKNLL